MKIAFFEIQPWEKERLEGVFGDHELVFFEHAFKKEDIERVADCDALSVFIYSFIDK